MTQTKVNGIKLNKALKQFGSLDNSIVAMQKQNEQLMKQNAKLQLTKNNLSKQVQSLDSQLHERLYQVQSLADKIEHYKFQYDLFEGFLAMVTGSPSRTSSLEGLITTFQKLTEDWLTVKNSDDLRSIFIRTVMGDYLKCYRCDSCGARFIVNKEPGRKYNVISYKCPACHFSHQVAEDDSFLKAMVSEEQMENVYRLQQVLKENEALKPLKVFLNLPCEVCGQPITEWTDYMVQKGVKEQCWGHANCWNSDKGQIKQLMKLAKEELEKRIVDSSSNI